MNNLLSTNPTPLILSSLGSRILTKNPNLKKKYVCVCVGGGGERGGLGGGELGGGGGEVEETLKPKQ